MWFFLANYISPTHLIFSSFAAHHRQPVVSSPIKKKAPAFRITQSGALTSTPASGSGGRPGSAGRHRTPSSGDSSPVSDLLGSEHINNNNWQDTGQYNIATIF